ncbi:TPA: hypothetical protein R1715_001549, partial [Campylobacter lari]|nr:hypothetical protein [Campylobacter lari]
MPLYNFTQFLSLLAQLSEIDFNILMENRDTLLKALSSLSEKKFNTEECSYLLEILERTFLDKLYYIDSNKKKEIC